ncbi:TRAP transporter small permease [Desulfurispira natronophila]|uniref:TRAP-type C4-dicarboxylate transport system permease small subunit n=1 Tax=Desulfurispira natronophila TaxID=682562 RepID=A0A7W8DHU4_9BACT|nr:TRAP transporter small permease [Desulfurispira natronophila]MBB5022814.1 TRAP-type C4-dicarboxylate transport system permease small subunit [Desulfurispira natronophila]
MKKIMRAIDKALGQVEDWTLFTAVIVALLAAMANIVLRKTTDISFYWSDEVVRKVIFFTTFMGASAAIRRRSMIRIDAVPQLLPLLQKPLTVISHLTVIAFSACMMWLGTTMTLMVYDDPFARTSTLDIPEWYFYAVLPVVGGMMLIRTIIQALEDWMNFRSDDSSSPSGESSVADDSPASPSVINFKNPVQK